MASAPVLLRGPEAAAAPGAPARVRARRRREQLLRAGAMPQLCRGNDARVFAVAVCFHSRGRNEAELLRLEQNYFEKAAVVFTFVAFPF